MTTTYVQSSLEKLQSENEAQVRRIAELKKSVRFYATESHLASGDPKHNRLHFEDCDHPDCIKARQTLARQP